MKWSNTNLRVQFLLALLAVRHFLRNPHLLDLLASLLERLFGGPETNIGIIPYSFKSTKCSSFKSTKCYSTHVENLVDNDHCRVGDIMKSKGHHTTLDGLNPIQKIKSGMNKGRVNELSPKSVMLTSSFFPPGLINLIKVGLTRLSKNIVWLSTIITSYPLYMFEFIVKLKKVVYFLLFLYLVIKNLTSLLDLFWNKSVLFASFDANSADDLIQDRKIKVENKMIEYQKEQLREIKDQLSTLQNESNLSKEQLEEKEYLLKEKGEIERFISKEVKVKIDLTKNKSSYNTSNISGSKRLGEDLNAAGPSHKK